MNRWIAIATLLFGGSLLALADNLSQEGVRTASLANGIPVVFKANPNNQVLALNIFLTGGSTLMTPETAGWEGLALDLLTRGSAQYSYDQLKDLQWRTSASFTANAAGFDGASYGLVVLPDSFDPLFNAWMDGFLHPRWDPKEFDQVVQAAKMDLQQKQQDPHNRAVTELNRSKFARHPYRADFNPTVESLERVTVDQLRMWWESNLKTGRLSVVAVGNFDFPGLKSKLDRTLGTLPAQPARSIPVPSWTPSGSVQILPFADAGDVGYLRADFAIPGERDPDHLALDLAFTVLNDVLYDVVRTQHGAAYGVWARTHGFLAPYGSLEVFKTDKPGEVKAWVDEAVALVASGKALASQASASAAGKGGIGTTQAPKTAQYVPLAHVLGFYKAKSINGFYEGQQTNSSIAGQMAFSRLYRGDPLAYLDYARRIEAVTPEDVVRVLRRYVQSSPKDWVVLAGPELLKGVTEATFLK